VLNIPTFMFIMIKSFVKIKLVRKGKVVPQNTEHHKKCLHKRNRRSYNTGSEELVNRVGWGKNLCRYFELK